MEFEDVHCVIKFTFMFEYCIEYCTSPLDWTDFIKKKDIGIECTTFVSYHIIDYKKWCLARLKYGI